MGNPPSENFLPSIARLLHEAGAARAPAVDTDALARQPVFATNRWRESIAEFLRWSGTTLTPSGEASVYDLVLGHGRVGAAALYNAFREYLVDRGGALEPARAKLEAVRNIPSMAAHWLHLIDWDLDDAARLEPADLRERGTAVVRLPIELSERVKKVAAKDPARSSAADIVEQALEEKLGEMESENGGPSRPKTGNGPVPSFSMGRVIRDLWRNEVAVSEEKPSLPPLPRKPPRPEI